MGVQVNKYKEIIQLFEYLVLKTNIGCSCTRTYDGFTITVDNSNESFAQHKYSCGSLVGCIEFSGNSISSYNNKPVTLDEIKTYIKKKLVNR